MPTFNINVHLSNDFRRSCFFHGDDGYEKAAADGLYDGFGFSFKVEAKDHLSAAEMAYAICNSYPDELHCHADYEPVVAAYRAEGYRSLSVGDLVMVFSADGPHGQDGRYGVTRFGFERF